MLFNQNQPYVRQCKGRCCVASGKTINYSTGSPVHVTDLLIWTLIRCQNAPQQFIILQWILELWKIIPLTTLFQDDWEVNSRNK